MEVVKRVEAEPSKLRYGLITGLATAGLVETTYLTWMKLYGGPVSCPLGGTGCDDVLNSEYGTIFGMNHFLSIANRSIICRALSWVLFFVCRGAFVAGRDACIWNCGALSWSYGDEPEGSCH